MSASKPIAGGLPLEGLRVLEIGHYIAAPFATRVLADLGAEVIKVEPPVSGDPVRQWGLARDGHAYWWSVHGRNKKCVTLNLKSKEGRALLEELVARSDALVENLRPGQLRRLGFDDDRLLELRPNMVICHVSGYGLTGPLADRACFGAIGEALGGLRYLSNHTPGTTDLPPVRVGVSIGDSIAGLYAVIAVLAGLWSRAPHGRVADVALTEAVLSIMEGVLPEYGGTGTVREPSGGRISTAAPTNAFPTADGGWVLIAANSDALFRILCKVMERPELADDPQYRDNPARCRNVDALEAEIAAWTRRHDAKSLESRLAEADIPSSRVYTAADIAEDLQFNTRKMVQWVDDPRLGKVLHPGSVPMFGASSRQVRWAGPDVGEHNREVYCDLLGLDEDHLNRLSSNGVV
ncbi:CaiB/BaiF CoA transferase family protein [Microvirga arsenatis]|uniref:CoA transferase n=1 Tax=Microvirga arsenatis TaxID=2692265 RepID=A0ABW9YYM9_9HYPH|nr:CoA transferase [Microvirga arsenatis]NBJ11144.1 CoA transferase [Microvirga arsenatis]NBJ25417.1 CoA transferase [Microvirga arsenatis]